MHNPDKRESVFALLESELLSSPDDAGHAADSEAVQGIDPSTGRPGMDLWSILVFGVVKQSLDCDYDRLEDLANNHVQVRTMLGAGEFGKDVQFNHRTIARNVDLLSPQLLRDVNKIMVDSGHALAGHEEGHPLQGRCDSFVVETDVHYPTDVNLLWDALRCLIREIAASSKRCELGGWRQSKHLTGKVRTAFNRTRTANQRVNKEDRVQVYLNLAADIVARAEESLQGLEKVGEDADKLNEIKG